MTIGTTFATLSTLSDRFLKAVRYPRRAALEIYGLYRERLHGGVDGVEIMDEDWDNLIILDACRYDLFEEINDIPGDLRRIRSLGTHTGEFQRKNFANRRFPDTVYVLASPNPAQIEAEFADVKHLWVEEWSDKYHTVHPEDVTAAAIRASEEYPDKRILVHYMQPHYPWIGERGLSFHEEEGYTFLHQPRNVWWRLRRGELDPDRVWECYRENLVVTLPHVERLLEELVGKSIVTSDHGNAFGEWGAYGHEARAYISPVVDVPWLEISDGQRKSIEPARSTTSINYADGDFRRELVEERLENLGYRM